jgi:hypothetical protein
MDPQQAQAQAMHAMAVMLPMIFLFWVVIMAFLVFVFWRIFVKAGMSGALGLLVIIPGVGWLIALCILAFSEWKVAPIAPQAYYPPPPVYPTSTPPTTL